VRVLVTGASGFLGQHLVAALRDANFQVRAAGRRYLDIGGVDWVLLPQVEHCDWKEICKDIDIVVHLAAVSHARGVSSEKLQIVNRDASISLAKSLLPDQGFVFISSIRAVAGSRSQCEVSEDTLPNPSCAYGRLKLDAENKIKNYHVNSCILRPLPVYGAGTKNNMKLLALMARTGLPIPIGFSDQLKSFLSVENFCSAVIFVIKNKLRGTYHVSDPDTQTLSQFVSFYRGALDRRHRVCRVPLQLVNILRLIPFFRFAMEAAAGALVSRPALLMNMGWKPIHKSTEQGVFEWATGGRGLVGKEINGLQKGDEQ
jgi:nucleoside-diphosphate-sugar epimerase